MELPALKVLCVNTNRPTNQWLDFLLALQRRRDSLKGALLRGLTQLYR